MFGISSFEGWNSVTELEKLNQLVTRNWQTQLPDSIGRLNCQYTFARSTCAEQRVGWADGESVWETPFWSLNLEPKHSRFWSKWIMFALCYRPLMGPQHASSRNSYFIRRSYRHLSTLVMSYLETLESFILKLLASKFFTAMNHTIQKIQKPFRASTTCKLQAHKSTSCLKTPRFEEIAAQS